MPTRFKCKILSAESQKFLYLISFLFYIQECQPNKNTKSVCYISVSLLVTWFNQRIYLSKVNVYFYVYKDVLILLTYHKKCKPMKTNLICIRVMTMALNVWLETLFHFNDGALFLRSKFEEYLPPCYDIWQRCPRWHFYYIVFNKEHRASACL